MQPCCDLTDAEPLALRETCVLLRTVVTSGSTPDADETYKTLMVQQVDFDAADVYGTDITFDTETVTLAVNSRALRPGSLPANVRKATYKDQEWQVARTFRRNAVSTGIILTQSSI